MGQELTPAQASSVRFLEVLYDAHPERAVGGFRPPRVSELLDHVEALQARIAEFEDKAGLLRKAEIETGLLKKQVEDQQKVIDNLINEVDGGIIGEIPSVKLVVTKVAEFYGVKMIALCGTNRVASIARVRHIAMYLCREMTGKSFPIIGRALGDRDHTTIMHGHRVISADLETDERLGDEISLIKLRIAGQ